MSYLDNTLSLESRIADARICLRLMIPHHYPTLERHIPAKFYSMNLQQQIDQLFKNVNDICTTIELLRDVVYRLVTLQEQKMGVSVVKDSECKYLHYF